MVARPTLKRFYAKKCTQCGHRLVTDTLVSRRYKVSYPHGEELWCRACAGRARDLQQLGGTTPETLSARAKEELRAAYIAYLEELDS